MSNTQAVNCGNRVMRGEEIHKIVTECFYDEENKVAMARAYAGHHQIVRAIIHHEGGNEYLKRGMHFGVRNNYTANPDNDGVELIELAPEREEDTAQHQILNTGLKHPKPDINELLTKYGHLNIKLDDRMVDFFQAEMDSDLLAANTEMIECWERLLDRA